MSARLLLAGKSDIQRALTLAGAYWEYGRVG
jgi:hypothetical protein